MIKRFKQYINENYLFEGGNAVHDTKRISIEDVPSTINDIYENMFPKLEIKETDSIRLGSSGHTETSGDIDFGIMLTDLSAINDKFIVAFPKEESHFMKGIEVLSVTWPINKSNERVQVDFLPVYDKDWTKFIYKYPENSKYKSAHRNWMLMAILSSIRDNVVKDENGNVTAYDGYFLNLNKGLFSMHKSYVGKTKLLKHGTMDDEVHITSDPKEFLNFAFGKDVMEKDVNSFENCWNLINSNNFRWKKQIQLIKDNFIDFLDRAELKIPSECHENKRE